jgi:hypothetical protein
MLYSLPEGICVRKNISSIATGSTGFKKGTFRLRQLHKAIDAVLQGTHDLFALRRLFPGILCWPSSQTRMGRFFFKKGWEKNETWEYIRKEQKKTLTIIYGQV